MQNITRVLISKTQRQESKMIYCTSKEFSSIEFFLEFTHFQKNIPKCEMFDYEI